MTGNDTHVGVLGERCIVCCIDVKCWGLAYTGGSVVVVGGAGGAEVEKISGGVIGLGIMSGNKLVRGGVVGGIDRSGTITPTKESIEEE